MPNKIIGIIIACIIALMIFFSSIFTIKQGDQAVILRFGELNTNQDKTIHVYNPGLYFKIPLIDSVKPYDMRLRVLTTASSRMYTKERKEVLIDAYLQWKISDISQFYRRTNGNIENAESLLKQYLESSLRAEVGKNTIQELINTHRDVVMSRVDKSVENQSKNLGISVIDVRIKQIDFPDTVTQSIVHRMKSDREKEATYIRANGEQLSERIKANADAQVTINIAEANKQSFIERAKADEKAATIYTNTYSKSPKFYKFLRSMQAYESSLTKNKNNVFILKPKGKFFAGLGLS